MSKLLKVEIAIVDGDKREWQWLGKISKAHLKALCSLADDLSDLDTDTEILEAVS